MQHSLIICSRNRAAQLRRMLGTLDAQQLQRFAFEVVLVDSASSDDTMQVMMDFARSVSYPVIIKRAERPGLSHARNVGVAAARGEKLLFTDDDCYPEDDCLPNFVAQFNGQEFQFGGGDIYLFDLRDAMTGCGVRPHKVLFKPYSLIATGVIQGANMFFLKLVFDKLGGFREDLGAGTEFPCEDIEMCTRASLAGFTGAILPDVKVLHHHGRRKDSPEFERQSAAYERGRGAYYALLLSRGIKQAWQLWSEQFLHSGPPDVKILQRYARELRSAADYLEGEIAARLSQARGLEHVPEKLNDFSDENML